MGHPNKDAFSSILFLPSTDRQCELYKVYKALGRINNIHAIAHLFSVFLQKELVNPTIY